MPILVACALGSHSAVKGGLQVSASLVGQAERHKKHVRQLFAQILAFIGLLFGLLSVAACNNPRDFAHLFAELRHVGELVKVAHSKVRNPLINLGLQGPKG